MSPVFMGAEPVKVEVGKYAGDNIDVFRAEENNGLALVRSLNSTQRNEASCFLPLFRRTCQRTVCTELTLTFVPVFLTTILCSPTRVCALIAYRGDSRSCCEFVDFHVGMLAGA